VAVGRRIGESPVSLQAVGEVLARAGEDEEFRQKVLADAPGALAAYDLSPAEVEAFAGGELRALLIGSASTS
jgi:hypothetical protein